MRPDPTRVVDEALLREGLSLDPTQEHQFDVLRDGSYDHGTTRESSNDLTGRFVERDDHTCSPARDGLCRAEAFARRVDDLTSRQAPHPLWGGADRAAGTEGDS